ncbi:MAG: GAF domain-containing protein [Anaerolineae bacterium]|nr:GAF domain-containing protein [Anaerolineae bacterium]
MSGTHGLQARFSETLRLALVYRLAHELNANLSAADVLRRVLNATAEALGTPHASIIAFAEGQIRSVYALGGGSADPLPAIRRVMSDGLAGFVYHNYRTVIVNDITNSPLWMPQPGEPFSPQTGSALCVPLIHSGEVVGVMTLAHPARSYFTADAINLTSTITEMGAAALFNALLLESARQAEMRYSALFDDVIVPIIITNLDGQIQDVNRRACEFLGYAREELIRQNISKVHRMGTGPIGQDRFDHLKRGLEVSFQSVVWTKAGSDCPVQVYAKRINSPTQGDHIQWIEHDLSPQIELDRVRRDLSAMVYHDMRGPLGNVYTSLQALQTLLANHSNANVVNLLEVAVRSERQVRRMVDSLLDVQRLEAGQRLLSRRTVPLNGVIANALQQVRPSAEDKSIGMRFALADDLPMLYIDSDMIERVVINLLDNAIKYSFDHGIVTVSTATSGSEVYVRIKDTGPGVPPEAQATIFDKFARVKQRNMPHGVGLGLAFCKLAVDAHGGRIWVRSDQTGATFTFALPVEAPATKELPALGAAVPQAR